MNRKKLNAVLKKRVEWLYVVIGILVLLVTLVIFRLQFWNVQSWPGL